MAQRPIPKADHENGHEFVVLERRDGENARASLTLARFMRGL
jgi:hypothetical protein